MGKWMINDDGEFEQRVPDMAKKAPKHDIAMMIMAYLRGESGPDADWRKEGFRFPQRDTSLNEAYQFGGWSNDPRSTQDFKEAVEYAIAKGFIQVDADSDDLKQE